MDSIIGLDFETYSFTDLIVHGLDNYTHDEYFTPLIACTHGPKVGQRQRFDFIADYNGARSALIEALGDNTIAAHNAGFEQAVLEQLGIDVPSNQFVDTAVLARAAGAAGKLEAAAPQLMGTDKLETGLTLIKLFSIPGEYQARVMNGAFDPQIVAITRMSGKSSSTTARWMPTCRMSWRCGCCLCSRSRSWSTTQSRWT